MHGKFGARYQELTLNALRIVAGLLFMVHGGQKLFGWFGAQAPAGDLWPHGVAGVIEFFGGWALALGFFTRYVAFVTAGEMAVTFWWQHVARSGHLWPWQNRGELPMLFCAVWLYVWASGGGRWTLESWLRRRVGRGAGPG